MHAVEIGPAQLKSVAAVAKEVWSLTQGGSEEKSTGKWECPMTGAIERRSTRRGDRKNNMSEGWIEIASSFRTRKNICSIGGVRRVYFPSPPTTISESLPHRPIGTRSGPPKIDFQTIPTKAETDSLNPPVARFVSAETLSKRHRQVSRSGQAVKHAQ